MLKQPLELLDQTRFVNLLADAAPVVQTADDDRLRRQIEQRAGAEGRDDLALADLTVGAGIRFAASVVLLHVDVVQRLAPRD